MLDQPAVESVGRLALRKSRFDGNEAMEALAGQLGGTILAWNCRLRKLDQMVVVQWLGRYFDPAFIDDEAGFFWGFTAHQAEACVKVGELDEAVQVACRTRLVSLLSDPQSQHQLKAEMLDTFFTTPREKQWAMQRADGGSSTKQSGTKKKKNKGKRNKQ